ncbi:putative [Myosin heavy-chain] kinase chromatin regulator PHD family [Dioscorea sansibarensis]
MEVPECPVCLQTYDTTLTVPRVLACGHTFCDPCIASLPLRPSLPVPAARCPICSQIVPLSSLPKKLDLLSFASTPKPNPNPDSSSTNPRIFPEFRPVSFPQSFVSEWGPFVLPRSSISFSRCSISSQLGSPWFCDEGRKVSFLKIGVSPKDPESFRLSYSARVMDFLSKLRNETRDRLGFLIKASWRHRRGISRILGVWMDSDREEEQASDVFLVSERLQRGIMWAENGEKLGALIAGMELCEGLMGLHSDGIACGSLGDSCVGFDKFGHCVVELDGVLKTGERIQKGLRVKKGLDLDELAAFVAPEVLVQVPDGNCSSGDAFDGSIACAVDVWSLSCTLVASFGGSLLEGYSSMLLRVTEDDFVQLFRSWYDAWREQVSFKLEALLHEKRFQALLGIIKLCLSFRPEDRPHVSDVWHCIKDLFDGLHVDDHASSDAEIIVAEDKPFHWLILQGLFVGPEGDSSLSSAQDGSGVLEAVSANEDLLASKRNCNDEHLPEENVNGEHLVERLHGGGAKSISLCGHNDSVTGLAIGGGFLFSSSFDKTINVWSLQDFSHVQTLRAHAHRVMAILVVENGAPLCISGDSGSGICIWSIGTSLTQEPLKKWYEHNDWRYSGIHALAVSGTGYLYSGSGDKSIKAWSLQDYSLLCTMNGHKSTVSALAVADGILYSGSWDGTIRLWWITDHSPLVTLGEDTPENLNPVLSLSVHCNILASSYENGNLKLWRNNTLVKTMQIQNGSLFALDMDTKWLFTGGWNEIIDIQELSENDLEVDIKPVASINCDSIITCVLHWHGKLFVGLANKEIKVYSAG